MSGDGVAVHMLVLGRILVWLVSLAAVIAGAITSLGDSSLLAALPAPGAGGMAGGMLTTPATEGSALALAVGVML